MTFDDYDNAIPLFLGGPFHGEIRLIQGKQDLLKYAGVETSVPVVYQRWVLAAGGREWVFYRSLGMTDADALGGLVQLAESASRREDAIRQMLAESRMALPKDGPENFPGPCGSGNENETKNKTENDTPMWKKVIKVLKNALELAKADPADKQEIRRLTQENSDLAQELAAALAACPSNEDREQIANLVDEFAAAIPVVEPVTPEPSITPVDAGSVVPPVNEPTGSSGDVAPPTTPYPGAVGQEVAPAAPAEAVGETPVEAQAETPAQPESTAGETSSQE